MDIEIRYFDDCPNWRDTADLVRELADDLGVDLTVRLKRVATQGEAERLAFVGSPTVLIDGTDPFAVDGAPVGLSCRIYRTEEGFAGAPTEGQLREALIAASGR